MSKNKVLILGISLLVIVFVWTSFLLQNRAVTSNGNTNATSSDSGGTTKPPRAGTITGMITLSPTCPVETLPPDPSCAPKAYSGFVDVTGQDDVFTEVHANAEGVFLVNVPPGAYTINIRTESLYPRCESKKVTVVAEHTVTVDISCDSGIR